MIEVKGYGLMHYVCLLQEGQPFAFSRYGNGEWGCILRTHQWTGTRSQRIDIPALRAGMIRSIVNNANDKNYYLAIQSPAYLKRVRLYGKIEQWVRTHAPLARWVAGDVLHKASMHSQLAPMIRQLRKMRVVLVGPRYLQGLKGRVINYERFVAVAPRNCYAQYKEIRDHLNRMPKGVVMVFSAGPTTKVLISDLWRDRKGHSWFIDFGSMWDPYVGKNTRRYHKRVTKAVQKANLK